MSPLRPASAHTQVLGGLRKEAPDCVAISTAPSDTDLGEECNCPETPLCVRPTSPWPEPSAMRGYKPSPALGRYPQSAEGVTGSQPSPRHFYLVRLGSKWQATGQWSHWSFIVSPHKNVIALCNLVRRACCCIPRPQINDRHTVGVQGTPRYSQVTHTASIHRSAAKSLK